MGLNCYEVQQLASGAVSWCQAMGGNVEAKDLVGKISKIAACGKHPQNAERDLQNTIRSFGKSMGIKIDNAPVRMFDPSTEAIFETNIPVLCPVSLAEAIWKLGADVFEAVFLGKEGPSGAEKFWKNAKQNASWFQANTIAERAYRGLIPTYLYGDDVEAYRNSDPGAISAIGWGSDSGNKNEAMLQTFLLTVYAEYTACEFTHNDIVEFIMAKFKHMADVNVAHPWHAGNFRFHFCSCRGDLKWINEPSLDFGKWFL